MRRANRQLNNGLIVIEGSSGDCCNEGVALSPVGEVSSVRLASIFMGMVNSSNDPCDDGTMNSSEGTVEGAVVGEGAVEMDVVDGGAVEISGCSEAVTSSYPDPPSVRITSGTPSIESRRSPWAGTALVRSRVL
jgi:hypothetical protein